MMSSDVESLIDLKFTLEKEISLYNETYNKINNNCIYSGGSIEYNLYNKYRTNMNTVGSEYINKQKELLKIYNRVFNQQKQRTSCGSCIKTMTDELKILFNQYD